MRNRIVFSTRAASTEDAPRNEARHILGMRVDGTSYRDATERVLSWARSENPRYVCAANVHMTMTCYDDPEFRAVVNDADLVTPDGMPLVWSLRRLGIRRQTRVYGPTLTDHLCEAFAAAGVPVGFYGGREETLDRLVATMRGRYPGLRVAYAFAPPFRPLDEAEDDRVVEEIRASGARLLFVGLGCPKQERWMAEHRSRLPLVQVGVGAAFDFHAGEVRQAPGWIQNAGMEWAFRLAMEPRRLWRRYLYHNPRFVWLIGRQLIASGRT